MSVKKIFVVGGGTGGHFFPAVSLGEVLQNRGYGIYVITDSRCKKYVGKNFSLKVKIISCDYFKKGFLQNIKAFFKIASGVFESLTLLIHKRPKMVIGFGGYPMVPMLFAAKMLGIPIVLHEQNSFFGKANNLFAKDAQMIALSFEDTKNLDPSHKEKVIVTGNPIRDSIYKLNIDRNFEERPLKILIYGGSQGAAFFDNLVPNAMKMLREKDKNIQIEITQQAPKHDHEKIKNVYKKLKIKANIQEFFHDMDEQLRKHHFCISRAGASTIAELVATGMPSILIPFPFAANDHQMHNAKFLMSKKAAIIFEQNKVSPALLANKIITLASNPELLTEMFKNLLRMKTNSSDILATKIENLIHNR
jgi:UDP-N-acetylglucosamine--N-acetylmuramyl-(pentapeptide) pyrophosphoryl-undecaprenol N-acetylglucosamine transferase